MNTKTKKNLLTIIFFIIFVIITILVLLNKTTYIDNKIYNIITKLKNYEFIDIFFKSITRLGNTLPTIVIVLILILLLNKKYKILLINVELITIMINQGLKHIIRRPRPPIIERLISEKGYSYPSGHTMMALCLYGTLIYIIYKEIKNKKLKVFLITILSLLILLIGLSRIYVRVHYPSDVLGGIFLTLTILLFIIPKITNHFRGNEND